MKNQSQKGFCPAEFIRAFANNMNLKVLYEDNHLIAVFKPAGVLVQSDIGKEICLMDEVKTYLKTKYNKKGNVFLGLLHRLDRPVSGIVLFAKTSKGASRLSEQFRNHQVKKYYQAVLLGKMKNKKGVLINYLKKDPQKNKTQVFAKEVFDSKKAELEYEVIKSNEKYSLVKIRLITGRPHQIRAQFSHIGNPVLGDVKYGAPNPQPDKSIALCCIEMSFKLATKDEKKKIEIEMPKEMRDFFA